MRLLLLLCAVVCVQGTFVSLNTLNPGVIRYDFYTLTRTEYWGYFWDDPNFLGNNFIQTGSINGHSRYVTAFNNNAGKSVQELFGTTSNVDRFCFSQHYYKRDGMRQEDWEFQFKAVLMFQGFQQFDLHFYENIPEESHIVTFERRGILGSVRIGGWNLNDWRRSDFQDPSGFDRLVSKITNGISVKFYLEFKNLHITVPTTIPSTTAAQTSALVTTAAQTSAPVTTAAQTSAPVTTAAQTSALVTTAAQTSAPVTTAAQTSAPVTTATETSAPVTTVAPTNEKSSVVEETVKPEILDENLLTVDSNQETNVPMDKTWVSYIFLTAGFIAIIIVFVIAIYAVRRFRRNLVHHSTVQHEDLEVVVI